MPTPTTVLEYHTQALATFVALKAAAQADLSAAKTALTAAQTSRDAATAEIAAQLALRASTLASLGAISLPADAAPLLVVLEEILIALHAAQGDLVSARDALAAAEGQVARASAKLSRATAGETAQTTAVAAATTLLATQTAWKNAINSADHATVKASALAAFVAATDENTRYLAAETRIDDDFPAELLTRAHERELLTLADATAARDAYDQAVADRNTELDTNGGLAGQVAKLTSEMANVSSTMRDRATQTTEQYDRAVRLLDGIAASTALTAAEADAIAALSEGGIPAADAQKALEDAIAASSDPSTDPAVAAAQAAYDLLATDLDKWEASMPARIWKNLADFEGATRILTDLGAFDGAALIASFDAAESALAGKLDEALTSTLATDLLRESLLELGPIATRAETPEQIFSALRGDA